MAHRWRFASRWSSPPRSLSCGGRNRDSGSSVAGRLQIIVGLDDLAQLVLAGAVAAVRVGMVPLHQLLEARLDLIALRARFEAEFVQRLAGGVVHGALGLRS